MPPFNLAPIARSRAAAVEDVHKNSVGVRRRTNHSPAPDGASHRFERARRCGMMWRSIGNAATSSERPGSSKCLCHVDGSRHRRAGKASRIVQPAMRRRGAHAARPCVLGPAGEDARSSRLGPGTLSNSRSSRNRGSIATPGSAVGPLLPPVQAVAAHKSILRLSETLSNAESRREPATPSWHRLQAARIGSGDLSLPRLGFRSRSTPERGSEISMACASTPSRRRVRKVG